jgi:putative FmdB family regulatory protein
MPIYAYRCDECGFAKDVLQKMSDPVLTVCPSCGKSSFKKQVTAAGFQLKGTGWYVTDFRGGNAPATGTAPAADSGSSSSSAGSDSTPSAGGNSAGGNSAAPAPAPASTPGDSTT